MPALSHEPAQIGVEILLTSDARAGLRQKRYLIFDRDGKYCGLSPLLKHISAVRENVGNREVQVMG